MVANAHTVKLIQYPAEFRRLAPESPPGAQFNASAARPATKLGSRGSLVRVQVTPEASSRSSSRRELVRHRKGIDLLKCNGGASPAEPVTAGARSVVGTQLDLLAKVTTALVVIVTVRAFGEPFPT